MRHLSQSPNLTSSWELSQLLQQITTYVEKNSPKNLRVQSTGEGILINTAADYMAVNQVTGFGSTFFIIGLIHALMFMSFKGGFISLLPNVVPIVFNFGLMGALGIPLNVGTSLIAAIALGIAVDDTVHFMVRYSTELNEVHDQEQATYRKRAMMVQAPCTLARGGFRWPAASMRHRAGAHSSTIGAPAIP